MKRIVFCLLLIGFIFCSNAQKRSGLGLHAGTNVSGTYDISYGYYNDMDPAPGYQVGLRYNLKLGPIGVCSEVNWNAVSYNDPPTTLWGNYLPGGEVNLNYVSIPVLLKFYIGGFNIHVGAQSSYLVSGTNAQGDDITSDENYISLSGVDTWLYNEMDLAAVFGVGLDMKNGLYFAWRSTASITPIGNLDVTEGYLGLDSDDLLRLVSGSLSVGYQF